MAGRGGNVPQAAIHFGNYDTVVTLHDAPAGGGRLLRGVAREVQGAPEALSVPSLIHFGDTVELGEEVLRSGKYHDKGTFQDLKDHVTHPADVPRVVHGRRMSHKQAAAEYLRLLVERLHRELGGDLDLALICPGYKRETCLSWLRSIQWAGARSVALVDEDTALALGHGVSVFEEDPVLVLDFGFSSIRARLVQFAWSGLDADPSPVVRASARVPFGMADLKLAALCRPQVQGAGRRKAPLDGRHSVLHEAGPDRPGLDRCLAMPNGSDATHHLCVALDRLCEHARLVNLRPEDARRVLLTGGGSSLSSVRRLVEERFGERVSCDPGGLAACRGGHSFLAGRYRDDMVRSTYCVRMRDPVSGEYLYPVIVDRFTRYPTRGPTARYIVNTYYDGQTAVNLEVFKSSDLQREESLREVVFGEGNRLSIVGIRKEPEPEPAMDGPLVITVNPPGRWGERRLHLEFDVDNQKRLRVSVRDLREQKTLLESQELIGLT
jgi:molecular chaperone DnaK (HSP70)